MVKKMGVQFLKRCTSVLMCMPCSSVSRIATFRSQRTLQIRCYQKRLYCSSNSDGPWTVHPLKSRGLLRLKGSDVIPYLQGLITNDVTHLGEQCKAMYAMMLNAQGRVLYDLIIYDTKPVNDTELYIECDRCVVTDLIKTMKMYKLRRKVDISDVSQELTVFGVLPPVQNMENFWELGNLANPKISVQDPRVDKFGWRIVDNDENSVISSFKSESDVNLKEEEIYHEERYKWGIAEGIIDLPPGNCFPLESNLVYMNGVCFAKGCYIGQELTARTYHTGATRKRLMPLVFESHPSELKAGDSISTESGKSAGKFRKAVGNYGLGLMRLANIKGQLSAKTENDINYTLTVQTPSWWPDEGSSDKTT